jgi:uncharacterized membrane protein HdeD (DUF308 family)
MLPHYAMRQMSRRWWVFLLSGFAWLLIAAVVLRFNVASIATVGLLLGAVFLFTAVSEFTLAAFQPAGWAVLRVILGVLFIGGAIWSFLTPYNAFWALAAAFGLLLILTGGLDIVFSALSERVNPLWWLGLLTGILEIALGFWASQQDLRARAVLLVLWVGIYAIFKGIRDLSLAFEVRSLGRHHPGSVDGDRAADRREISEHVG